MATHTINKVSNVNPQLTLWKQKNGYSAAVPYNPTFVRKVKAIGGEWDPECMCWSVPHKNEEALRQICKEVFGAYTLAGPRPRLSDKQFRCLLDLWMCTDPFPESVDDAVFTDLITSESKARGYATEIDAYHMFRVKA